MNVRSVTLTPARRCPSSHLLSAVLLAALATSGCGPHRAAAAKPPRPSGELVPVPLAELSFTHDALRQRIHRIDHIMGGVDYPAAKTIHWVRRPNGLDGRSDDDFVVQWSTVTDRLGVSIGPGQAPASTVQIYAEVDPKDELKGSPQIWRFCLRGYWRPKAPGWDALVIISANAVGKETIRVQFRHSDTTTLSLPFQGWMAAIPMPTTKLPLPAGPGFEQTRVGSRATDLSVAQVRALTKSAESFRDETVRLIAAVEARMIADILASRGVQRGTYRQVDNDGNTRFVASDPKDVEALSADEIEQFRDIAKKEFQRRRFLVQENYTELHAAILKAFPLDQYVADESIPDAP
jgi:hypothetical protein